MQLKLTNSTFQNPDGTLNVHKMVAFGKTFPAAGATALNKLRERSKVEAKRLIRERYNVKPSALETAFRFGKRATAASLETALKVVEQRKIPLAAFGARRIDARTVVVEVVRGQPKVVGGGFMQKPRLGRNLGQFVIYKRTGETPPTFISRKRLIVSRLLQELKVGSVKRAYGPSIAAMFGSTQVMTKLEAFAKNKMPELLASAINWKKK